MNILFSPGQNAYRMRVRSWLEHNLPPQWDHLASLQQETSENATFLIEWERKLYAAGYSGITWPREFGGQGLSAIDNLIANEEMGRRGAPDSVSLIGRDLVGPILLHAGTKEQKALYIPRILAVDDIWCQGFSEPNAGSDLAAIKTGATREGGQWKIRGQKTWTSYAHLANKCIVLARTNLQARRHRNLTLFIVDMKSPGVEVRPIVHINGKAHFNEVFFNDVLVDESMRIGEVGQGWQVAMGVLSFERATTRLFRQQRYMFELRRLASFVAADPQLRNDSCTLQGLGELYSSFSLLRYQNFKFIGRIAKGAPVGDEASILKLFWSVTHQKFSSFAVDVLGTRLFDNDPLAKWFQDLYLVARGETIYAGTSNIQKSIIAERMLGLPR